MFELGQTIICVKNHSQGAVKEGEIYTVKDLKLCPKCKLLTIDVGIKPVHDSFLCICRHTEYNHTAYWFSHTRFRPLDDLYNEELNEELSKIFTKQPFEL